MLLSAVWMSFPCVVVVVEPQSVVVDVSGPALDDPDGAMMSSGRLLDTPLTRSSALNDWYPAKLGVLQNQGRPPKILVSDFMGFHQHHSWGFGWALLLTVSRSTCLPPSLGSYPADPVFNFERRLDGDVFWQVFEPELL